MTSAYMTSEKDSEARLLLNCTRFGIWSVDREGSTTFANSAALKILGYDELSQIVGVKSYDILHQPNLNHPEQKRSTCQILLAMAEDRVLAGEDEVLWRRDGSEFVTEYEIVPLHDKGVVTGAAITFSDNTEKKRFQLELQSRNAKARDQLFAFFTQSPLPIVIIEGPEHRFTLVNPPYEKLTGRKALGRTVLEVFTPAEVEIFLPMLDRVYETGNPEFGLEMPFHILGKNGTIKYHWLNVSYHPLLSPEGMISGVFAIIQNMTEQVYARRTLEQGAQLLRESKELAESANRAKSQFLANMSHEIRTPLTAIIGFANLLCEKHLSPRDRQAHLNTISRSARALTRIVDDILDISKVEAGMLEIEQIKFSFVELLEDLFDLFKETAKTKGIFLRVNMDPAVPLWIVSDPTRIRQILINIVGNAIKFTREGGVTICLKAHCDENQKCLFEVLVTDTGVGIKKADREKLFQPFVQADNSTTRRFGGTGLGLALSQRLAAALGGTISFADEREPLKAGSSFLFTFVATIVPNSEEARPLPRPFKTQKLKRQRPLENIHILVAEDSFDNQYIISEILERHGAQVETVNNGREAYHAALDHPCDIVLMDIQMPEMDGYEATRSLREAGFKKPVIALTAHAMDEDRARTSAAGCNGHLTKPIDSRALIDTLESFLP